MHNIPLALYRSVAGAMLPGCATPSWEGLHAIAMCAAAHEAKAHQATNHLSRLYMPDLL